MSKVYKTDKNRTINLKLNLLYGFYNVFNHMTSR
ncbi:Transposase [Macrococcoides canis]|uniref:Uncharacterized protein n=1 Tax=Macrococcoides canis TaxID=1855823 RepID=A0A1W7A7U6_9STAP|nr:hypothetical protein MCCS_00210 [Macrococcus canis]